MFQLDHVYAEPRLRNNVSESMFFFTLPKAYGILICTCAERTAPNLSTIYVFYVMVANFTEGPVQIEIKPTLTVMFRS